MSTATLEKQEVIRIVNNPGEDKPWELKFDNISGLKKARAILNYPLHKFETEQKAVEVAEMLKSIIKADTVTVEGRVVDDKEDDHAEFFENIK